jgi:electron transfer flavoprotein beta subunit
MEILVCVKRVPDTAENEIEVAGDGNDIERDDLVYSVNEWDNYAVEEAIQIVDNVGGSVTVISVGDEDAEEVVRREMAMGANNGILLSDDAFEGSDGKGIASLLKAAVELFSPVLWPMTVPGRWAECWPPCWMYPMLPWSMPSKFWTTKS